MLAFYNNSSRVEYICLKNHLKLSKITKFIKIDKYNRIVILVMQESLPATLYTSNHTKELDELK